MSGVTVTHRRRSRARLYGELIGRITNLHEMHDGDQVTVHVRPMAGGAKTIATTADRSLFFRRARVPQGFQSIECFSLFNGMLNAIHVGTCNVGPGLNGIEVDLRGATLRGLVEGINLRHGSTTASIRLCAVNDDTVAHNALVAPSSRFVFTGLNPGTYSLSGEVPGQGTLSMPRVVVKGADQELDPLSIRPEPYLRLHLDIPPRTQLPRRAELLLWRERSPDDAQQYGLARIPSYLGEGHFALLNTFSGDFGYRFSAPRYKPVEGTLRLRRKNRKIRLTLAS